jgi:hypothetical protein
MTANRNSTDQQDTDDLRRSFMLALSDSLKTGEKVAAGTLEVVRKYLADVDAERRWQVEQAALVAGASGTATAPTTSEAPAPTPARVIHGVDLDKLPFPVTKRRGVEYPSAAPAALKATEVDSVAGATDTDKPTTWQGLSQVPFMTPND